MKTFIEHFSAERLTALGTTLTVATISMMVLFQLDEPNLLTAGVALFLFTNFMMLEILLTRDHPAISDQQHIALNLAQVATLYTLFFTLPYTFLAILLCIWMGNLLHYMSFNRAMMITPIFLFGYYAIFTWRWGMEHMAYSAPLYAMLAWFTLVMLNSWSKEKEAKQASQQLNRELLAAQSLLKEATKQSERVRIARDVHDLVGHHLTALTINLQVAMHKSDGEARQQVEKSYAIAKLLLADVREAVTEIREKSNIHLRDAIEALVSQIPRLEVVLELEDNLSITDVELAETLLKCVQESLTNSLKHSDCQKFQISLFKQNQDLKLHMSDSGQSATGENDFTPGNGLKGMQERIAAFNGRIYFEKNNMGFNTQIVIPEVV